MRIISGRNKGRRITAPASLPVRPTTDMAKESLFNILGNHMDFAGTDALDLFTGTGNIAYELASRGCPRITAVDIDGRCIRFVRKVADQLDYPAIHTVQADYAAFLKRASSRWDLIFADPPYALEGLVKIPGLIWEKDLLREGGWLVMEHDKRHDFSGHAGFYDHRKYGTVNFTFFRKQAPV